MSQNKVLNRKKAISRTTDVAKDKEYEYYETSVEGNTVNFYATQPGFIRNKDTGKNEFKLVIMKSQVLNKILKASVLEALLNSTDGIIHIEATNTHIMPLLETIDRLRQSPSMKRLFVKEQLFRLRHILTFEADKQEADQEEVSTYDRIIPGLRITLTVDVDNWDKIKESLDLMSDEPIRPDPDDFKKV
jgi:hypothetical protein